MRTAFTDRWLCDDKMSGTTKHREALDSTEAMKRIPMVGMDDNP
jgi:hypothetical protein